MKTLKDAISRIINNRCYATVKNKSYNLTTEQLDNVRKDRNWFFFSYSKSFPVSNFYENYVLPDIVKLLSCQVVLQPVY